MHVVPVVAHWPTKVLFDARYALAAYRLIAAPPLLADAVQVTVAEPIPATTDGNCGVDGTVEPTGVTLRRLVGELQPTQFRAQTLTR